MRFKDFTVLSISTFATLLLCTAVAGAVGSISGQVTLEHEVALLPVVGARVAAASVGDSSFFATALTDSGGNYQIGNLPPGRYKVMACKGDLGCLFYPGVHHPDSAELVTVLDGQVTSGIGFTFRLFVPPPPNPALLTGRITDVETGVGIANAWVGASGEFLTIIFETRTGPDGRYNLPVAAGGYFVRAAAHGYLSAEYTGNPVRVEAYDTASNVDIALRPDSLPSFGLITGLITDSATGNHLPRARVIAFIVRDNVFPIVYETISDTDGGYRLRVPPDSDYHVFAEKPGYHRGEYPGNPVAVPPNDTVRGVDIALVPGAEPPVGYITGRITDAQTGEGIPDAWVGASGEVLRIIFETRTGPDGRYFLPVLAEDRYNVRAAARSYEVGEYSGNPVAVEAYDTVFGVNIVLFQQPISIDLGSISGQVTNAGNGSPIPHALVVARQGDGFGFGSAQTDENGNYRIGPLPMGFYKVAAVARGFFPAVYPDPVEVRADENTPHINFRLHPVPPPDLGTISGMVTDDSTGEPIGCALVAAVGFDSTFDHRIVRFAHTDSAGHYIIDGLPKIPYFVLAWARGYRAEIYDNVHRFAEATKVTPDASGIDFALEKKDTAAHSLAGVILSSANTPLGGALVQAADGNGSEVGAALSLPDGGFVIDGLAPGSYTVSAALDGASISQNVDLSGGSLAGINLILPTGTTLRGDLNGNGTYEASDAVLLMNGVFLGQPLGDLGAADVNCDGDLTAADVVTELQLVFLGQSAGVCGF